MKPEDALRRLREADPAPAERVHGSARAPRAQEALDRILGGEESEPMRRPPRKRVPVALIAASLVIAIVVSVAIVQRSRDVDLRSVRVVLSQAAQVAAGTELPDLAAGEYLYARTDVVHRVTLTSNKGTWTALVPRRREIWIAQDGSGRILETPGVPRFPGPRDRNLWQQAGEPRLERGPTDRSVRAGGLLPDRVNSLPTETNALAEALVEKDVDSTLPPDVRLFVICSDLLSQPLVDPVMRSALYRVVASIDRVRFLGQVLDPVGRSGAGVAITFRSAGALQQRVLIFDETTSKILGEKAVLLENAEWIDADPPVTIDSRAYVTSGIVSSVQARPTA